MYGHSSGREILLLAAEDAFEFERWRDAGPVTADIDPEIKAAEIAEFEALAIPMPAELDSLRRELEHATKVREAIRASALAMRRSGRATASALVALGPQQLMPIAAGGAPWPMGVDPRLVAAGHQRVGFDVREPRPRSGRGAPAAPTEAGAVDAEVVDELADLDEFDEYEAASPRRSPKRRGGKRRGAARPARAARPRDEWAEDDEDDEDDEPNDSLASAVLAGPRRSDPRTTWVLGGITAAVVLALVWLAFDRGDRAAAPAADGVADQQPPQPIAAAVEPPPPVAEPIPPTPAIDPAPVIAEAPAADGGSRSVRSSGVRSPSAAPAGPTAAAPTAAAPTPAAPPPAQPPAQPSATDTEAPPSEAPPVAPPEQAKPVEPPKPPPEELVLPKSKMTPAIRNAVISKVGELQACYQEAVVAKPDLAGQVLFTISLDQDGVVKKVDIGKDEVKHGVAKCSAKKIQRWTLPSAGIPIIFDLPFDFQS